MQDMTTMTEFQTVIMESVSAVPNEVQMEGHCGGGSPTAREINSFLKLSITPTSRKIF